MLHSPQRTMVAVVMMVVTLLLAASGPGQCANSAEYDDDYEAEGCHPEEADHCFTDVNQNLLCNLGKPVRGRDCAKRDAQDLCAGMRDALACCEDILDSCTEGEGHDTFEVWLKGLSGVHQHLCHDESNLALVTVLLQGSKCFRLKRFINCVEERANLTHMADLLTTDLDLHECNKIQVAVGACIEDSEKNRKQCQGTSRAVTEALTAFFTSTACGQVPPPSPSPPRPPPPPLPPCLPPPAPGSNDNNNNTNNNSSSTTTTTTNTTTTTTNTTNSNNNTKSTSNEDNNKNTTTTTTTNTTRNSKPRDTSTTTSSTTTTTTSKAAPQVACQQKDLNTSGTPTASTVVVTVLVTLVLVGLAAMLLLKKGILVIRTDLDRRLISLNDEDGNSAYDRF